jgi:predicted dehydrogenase/nucleoside-diphosphate-sugar epimerase
VAVIGCGAITKGFHLPVLAGHEGVRVVALIDRDTTRAAELAHTYGIPTVLGDDSTLSRDWVDGVVICTPPAHHARCTIELASRGLHVFVEKPMAVVAADAQAMVEAAERHEVVLAAGYFRRLFPSARLLRAAIDAGTLGQPLGFDFEEGDEYTWALATLSNLRRDQGGGGVLIDIGSHVLDLLLYAFPGEWELLEYRDNARGGIETDCEIRLKLTNGNRPVEGRVELSRTRKLRSTLRVKCEYGTLELRTGERYQLAVIPHIGRLADTATGNDRPLRVQASWADEPETQGYEAYRAEIDDWLTAIRTGGSPQLSGESATRVVSLIEACYQNSKPLAEPWIEEGLTPVVPAAASVAPARPRKVLVTGASGFIGCRLTEILRLGLGWDVRALVHSPRSASRLARLPVEMVQGDLKSPDDVRRAVDGCDAVVHCAIGTTYGQRKEIFAVTVGGTENLLRAAREAKVERLVHLSSIAVHGSNPNGAITEDTPVSPTPGDDYSESKARAEAAVLAAARDGLAAVVLRPGNVYGAYGKTFITRPLQYLSRGALCLAGAADVPSNTVYVDNLVHAIIRGLQAPADGVAGQAFPVSDGDAFTWGEFYGYFAHEFGAELLFAPADSPAAVAQSGFLGRVFGWPLGCWRGARAILTSAEFRAFGKRILATDPWGRFPRWALDRFPGLDRRVKRLVGTEAVMVYRRPTPPAPDVMKIRARGGVISVEKTRKVLGYAPPVSRERALELTRQWARAARLG